MKVIHILNSLKFSGAEIMYVDAAPIFQQKGCELSVMATAIELGEYSPYFERAGFQIIHQPMPSIKNYFSRIKFYVQVVKLLKKEKFDVVHIHSSAAMWGFALCSWLAGVKSVYTFHNVFPSRFLTFPYHILKRWTAKNIFRCQFQTISDSVFEHELKFYHNNTTKVYNWYGNNRYFPAMDREKEAVRKALNISDKTFVLISIGGCSNVKRHSDIIQALPLILKEVPDCLYLHLGKGETESDEMQLVKDLGLEFQVRFCENQTDVRQYLIASDVYLMTSRFEGISLTTIEAMACKIPCILYDVLGLRDFNREGINSFLIQENYNLLAEKVIAVAIKPHETEAMALNAKNFVDEKFSIEKNTDQIFGLYV